MLSMLVLYHRGDVNFLRWQGFFVGLFLSEQGEKKVFVFRSEILQQQISLCLSDVLAL